MKKIICIMIILICQVCNITAEQIKNNLGLDNLFVQIIKANESKKQIVDMALGLKPEEIDKLTIISGYIDYIVFMYDKIRQDLEYKGIENDPFLITQYNINKEDEYNEAIEYFYSIGSFNYLMLGINRFSNGYDYKISYSTVMLYLKLPKDILENNKDQVVSQIYDFFTGFDKKGLWGISGNDYDIKYIKITKGLTSLLCGLIGIEYKGKDMDDTILLEFNDYRKSKLMPLFKEYLEKHPVKAKEHQIEKILAQIGNNELSKRQDAEKQLGELPVEEIEDLREINKLLNDILIKNAVRLGDEEVLKLLKGNKVHPNDNRGNAELEIMALDKIKEMKILKGKLAIKEALETKREDTIKALKRGYGERPDEKLIKNRLIVRDKKFLDKATEVLEYLNGLPEEENKK